MEDLEKENRQLKDELLKLEYELYVIRVKTCKTVEEELEIRKNYLIKRNNMKGDLDREILKGLDLNKHLKEEIEKTKKERYNF